MPYLDRRQGHPVETLLQEPVKGTVFYRSRTYVPIMLQEPVKGIEKRQMFHVCHVVVKSVAILLAFTSAIFMVLVVILAAVILLCLMGLHQQLLGQWRVTRLSFRDHVPHAIFDE
jgi:hypothetical protein